MSNTIALSLKNEKSRTVLFDLIAITAIAFLPAISHMISFPLYLLEPMRILLILSIAHTSKRNAFIIAAALPVLSFLLSGHPVLFKMFLIISEMMLNVGFFFYLSTKINNSFVAAFASIAGAKVYYYILKSILMSFGLIAGDYVATSLYLQVIVALVLSIYIFFVYGRSEKSV